MGNVSVMQFTLDISETYQSEKIDILMTVPHFASMVYDKDGFNNIHYYENVLLLRWPKWSSKFLQLREVNLNQNPITNTTTELSLLYHHWYRTTPQMPNELLWKVEINSNSVVFHKSIKSVIKCNTQCLEAISVTYQFELGHL